MFWAQLSNFLGLWNCACKRLQMGSSKTEIELTIAKNNAAKQILKIIFRWKSLILLKHCNLKLKEICFFCIYRCARCKVVLYLSLVISAAMLHMLMATIKLKQKLRHTILFNQKKI